MEAVSKSCIWSYFATLNYQNLAFYHQRDNLHLYNTLAALRYFHWLDQALHSTSGIFSLNQTTPLVDGAFVHDIALLLGMPLAPCRPNSCSWGQSLSQSNTSCQRHLASSLSDCTRGNTEASSEASWRRLRVQQLPVMLSAMVLGAQDASDAYMLVLKRWSDNWSNSPKGQATDKGSNVEQRCSTLESTSWSSFKSSNAVLCRWIFVMMANKSCLAVNYSRSLLVFILSIHSVLSLTTLFPPSDDPSEIRSHWRKHVFYSLMCCWT